MTTTKITRKHRLLFICLGNICRSPAAEGVMKAKVHAANLDEQFFMRERGARRGYRLYSRARQIRQTDFDDFDLLLVMDHENYRTVTSKAPDEEARKKVRLLTDYLQEHRGADVVPDPYYGGAQGFENVLDILEDACAGLLTSLVPGN